MKESFFTLFSLSKIIQLLILMNYLILHSNTLAAFTWSPISSPYNFSMASNFLFSMAVRVMFLNLKTVHVILLKMLHQFHIALGIKILSSFIYQLCFPLRSQSKFSTSILIFSSTFACSYYILLIFMFKFRHQQDQ